MSNAKLSLLVSIAMLLSVSAFAVDGVVLINQASVMAAGGFPYKITQSGSYRLSGNLTVPDANTTAIEIDSPNVIVDLNGFSIFGPTFCGFGGRFLSPCQPAGSGIGISTITGTGADNITVRNGNVEGMGSDGVNLNGSGNLVEKVHARNNGGNGITVGSGTVIYSTAIRNGVNGIFVEDCTVSFNTVSLNGNTLNLAAGDGAGISAVNGALVSNNTSLFNTHAGISITGTGSAINNSVRGNGTFDLLLGGQVGYMGNSLSNFASGPVSGGVSLGQNVCNGKVC